MKKFLVATVSAAVLVALASCGGGGNGGGGAPVLSQEQVDEVRRDPRVFALNDIFDGADTLLVPAVYFEFVGTGPSGTQRVEAALYGSCSGTECDFDDAETESHISFDLEAFPVASDELDEDVNFTALTLDKRRGFHTLYFESSGGLSERLADADEDEDVTATGRGYGLWAKYGFASTFIVDVSMSYVEDSDLYQVTVDAAFSLAAGNAAGSNPADMGSATWRGISEAVSTASFERRYGTATIRVPDLAQPSVDVDITVAGREIGSASWGSIPLRDGRYEIGIGGRDYVVGDFYGPAHQETYGVFDTGVYVGAFGASR